PLVPMTACTVPRQTSTETSSTAFRPPKLRETLRARSSTSPARCSGISQPPQLRGAPAELTADADDPVGHQRHARDDREAERQLPVLRELAEDRLGLEQLLQQHEREGAQHRAAQAAEAAEDDHDQH